MTTLLKENCMLEKQQLVKEGNRVKVEGIFQRADTPNKNGRVYTRGLWESILKRDEVKGMLEARNMLGELDHPDVTETSLKNVSHIVTKLELKDDNTIIGEAEILDTPNGLILQKLMEAGVKVGISSRGYVTDDSRAKQTKEGHYQVPESFVLKTFDFVVDPSTPGAFPSTINESVKQELISLIESAGDRVSPTFKTLSESLNTISGKGDEDMTRIIQLESELQRRDTTIQTLEDSYKNMYIENSNLKIQLQQIKEGAKVGATNESDKLESAVEIIEGLRDMVLEKDELANEAAEIIVGLTSRVEEAEQLLSQVIQEAEERVELSVGVIENLRDRYLTAEGLINDMADETKYLESQLTSIKGKVAKMESAKELEQFIVQKAKDLNMSESAVRENIAGAATIEEAKDKLLSVKSLMEKHGRSLPVGNKAVNEGNNPGNTPIKAKNNKLASAISRVR